MIGAWATRSVEIRRRRREFISKQLSEFYGPLLSTRVEIQAFIKQQNVNQAAANKVWQQNIRNALSVGGVEAVRCYRDSEREFYMNMIKDDNVRSRDVLIPAYRRMVEIFRDKMWLADPESRKYFYVLYSFVCSWEQYSRDSLPADVLKEIDQDEEKLHRFYAHIEKMHDRLQGELVGAGR